MNITKIGLHCLFGGALLGLVACNSSNSAIKEADNKSTTAESQVAAEATSETTEAAREETAQLANIATRKGGVANRGAYIKVLVNRTPITNLDIQRRASFLKLRRISGNRTQIAEREMIEQALKLEEARRVRRLATNEQVNTAFENFAKQNRSNVANLSRELSRLGVGAPHFKDYIRTQISWNRTVQGKFQAETQRVSERDAIKQLRESGNQKPKVDEFSFKQVIFVVPRNKRSKAALATRMQEANAFRQTVSGCDGLLQSIKALKDVAILDRRHIMEPELPPNWQESISQAGVGQTTPPQETEKGVEFMTICSSRTVDDDRAAQITQQATDFSSFEEQSSEFADKYLQELRDRAKIVYQ